MRRRWIYPSDGSEPYEVGEGYEPPLREHFTVVGDRHYDGMRAVDGTDISTRAKHREYMRTHNLTTADDYTNTWKKQAEERAERATTGGDRRERRELVQRAIYEQLNKRR